KDVLIVGDTGYVSVPGFYGDSIGRIAIIDLPNMSFVREDTLGLNAGEIGDLVLSNGKIHAISSITWGAPGTIAKYVIATGQVEEIVQFDTTVTKGVLEYDGLLYVKLASNMATIDVSDMTVANDNLINASFSATLIDTVDALIYGAMTDYFSYGEIGIFGLDGTPVDTFSVGISPEAMGFVWQSTVSVNEVAFVHTGVYPNPAQNIVIVTSEISNGTYQVVDVTGRTVQTGSNSKSKFELNVSSLVSGAYFITVSDDISRETYRLIKE
ncbi:MAG: T9SS type A sorting domain-containing protein, partial [Flavobacteriales bacterium]|nr:T9SS type A sorting domain-containing protein [Flavobacteriales bacterium]